MAEVDIRRLLGAEADIRRLLQAGDIWGIFERSRGWCRTPFRRR